MKKYLLSMSVLLAVSFTFVACHDDDDDNDEPKVVAVDTSKGVFVVGSGNMSKSISGNMSYIDYSTDNATVNIFEKVNGRKLGLTANDAMVYGEKLYIFVTNENTIEVCDRKTLSSIKQIKTVDLLGVQGSQPRHGFADDGKIYVSFFGDGSQPNGIVAAIDTLNFGVADTYEVGSYPEGLAVSGGYLYVANSDYGYGNASISKINLKLKKDTPIKHADINNPCTMFLLNNDLYVLDYGTYDEYWNQVGAGVRKVTTSGSVTKVADATFMGTDGKSIYYVNSPYGASTTNFGKYDVQTGQVTPMSYEGEIFSPAAISADPNTGEIFVASLTKNPETGYANYSAPGYLNRYDANGKLIKKYDIGVGPVAILFNTGVEYTRK